MPLFNDDGNIVTGDNNKTSIIDRLRWYIAQGPGGDIPSKYTANDFEEIFFFFVYLVYFVIIIIGIVLLFLSSPIWGPIYFIINLIKEHTKNEITRDRKPVNTRRYDGYCSNNVEERPKPKVPLNKIDVSDSDQTDR